MNRFFVYVLLATVLSGTIGVLTKLSGTGIHYMTLNFYRIFFAFLFLLAVVPLLDKKTFKLTKQDAGGYFMIGLVMAIAMSLYTTAFLFAPVQNVVFLNHLAPFFVFVLGYFFLKEKITSTKIITLLIAIVGIAIINPFSFESHNGLGNSLALASAFFYSILMVGMRQADRTHTIGDVMWFFFFASVLLLPFPFIFGWGFEYMSEIGIFLVPLGLFSTGLAYLYYNLSMQKLEAETTSLMKTIVTPLVAIILAIIFLGEAVQLRVVIGGALLIIAGVYLEVHSSRLKQQGRHKRAE